MRLNRRQAWGLIFLVLVMGVPACTVSATAEPTATGTLPPPIVTFITATPVAAAKVIPPTAVPTPVLSGNCTLNMAYLADVTIPDGTVMKPGNAFAKSWRVRNSGTCDWKQGTQLVFAGGEQMRGPVAVDVPVTSANGAADITVNLTAPTTPGTYTGRWRMRSPEGTTYGSLTVVIVIPSPPTPIPTNTPKPTATVPTPSELFNFHDQAGTATWTSNHGLLGFPGSSGDSQGYVQFRDAQELEDGNFYGGILETHPAWMNNGFIQGVYTVGEIKPGDRFRARVGFRYGGEITEGSVTFIVKGGNGAVLGTFGDTRDGRVISIDLDLTPVAGKTDQIVLRVEANNQGAAKDWACWVNPHIFGVR